MKNNPLFSHEHIAAQKRQVEHLGKQYHQNQSVFDIHLVNPI